jgi:hypothetical protein
MSTVRLITFALLVALALSATATSSAQAVSAPFWSIGGSRLVAGKTHNFDARADAVVGFTLEIPEAGVKVECAELRTEKGVLLGSEPGQPGKDDEIAVFSNCAVTGNGTPCTVAAPIKTNQITSELVESVGNGPGGHGKQLLEELKPVTPATGFVTLHFEGAGCTITEGIVSGSVAGEVNIDNPNNEPIELGQAPIEATSWMVNFPKKEFTEVLLVNTKGVAETTKVGLVAFGFRATLDGLALTLLANTKFESEPNAKWSPLP